MNKEIVMSIDEFMKVQRGELDYSSLNVTSNYTHNKIMTTLLFVSALGIIYGTINTGISASASTVAFTSSPNQQIDNDLIKEGFQVLFDTTSKLFNYAYKVLSVVFK